MYGANGHRVRIKLDSLIHFPFCKSIVQPIIIMIIHPAIRDAFSCNGSIVIDKHGTESDGSILQPQRFQRLIVFQSNRYGKFSTKTNQSIRW